MPDRAPFGPSRQEMVQVPTPARGVFSISVPTNFGPVEYGFHATADAARRFRLVGPDGLEHLHNQLGVDLGNGKVTDNRIGIIPERVAPQLCLLGRVAPALLLRRHELLPA